VTATRIKVGGGQPYEVVVGTGVLDELPSLVGPAARNVAVLHASGQDAVAAAAAAALDAAGYVTRRRSVPDGEAAKEISVAAGLWSWLADREFARNDVIVAVGGGAVTDLAGFVAATWLRGIRLVLVPTTLLGMADAAVGGKTAINIPAGKNLVGAFHPPAGVLADLATLATLSPAEYASGLAEVIKAGSSPTPSSWTSSRPTRQAPRGPAARTSASWSSGPSR
jgi:3-dehydroquinate synthase